MTTCSFTDICHKNQTVMLNLPGDNGIVQGCVAPALHPAHGTAVFVPLL